MKKQKIILLSSIILALFFAISFSGKALAAGSATVSWTPPETDEGGGNLTGLAGYRVYHDTTSRWTTTCPLDQGTYATVTGGATSSYTFENTLTAGQTHYFTVVAYDDATPPNLSGCASDGIDTEVNKVVTYTGDIDGNHRVNILDFNAFRSNWGNTNCSNAANFIGKTSNCTVNILDFNAFRADFGKNF